MTVLLVEDEDRIASFVTKGLGARGFEVRRVASGAEAHAAVSDEVGVVVLDLGLPDVDGLEVLRRLREQRPRLPVVILSARGDIEDRVRGLDLGADDYVAKPFHPDELAARVRAVLRRYQNQLPALGEVFDSADLKIDYASRHVTVKGQTIRLTPTEYSLLFHLTRNAGRVLPHQTLLAKVWGREYTDEIDYLKVYIRRLRQKLEYDTSSIGTIVSERGVGYKFVQA